MRSPEPSTKLQSVATGQSDVTQIAFDQLPVVQANPKLVINPYEKGIMYCAVMLTDGEAVDRRRVREAIKRSLDREKVMQVAYAGQAFASPDSCVAMGDPFMDDALTARTHDGPRQGRAAHDRGRATRTASTSSSSTRATRCTPTSAWRSPRASRARRSA